MPFNFSRKPKQLMVPKVLVIDFRPAVVPQEWRTATSLVTEFIEAMTQASHKLLVFNTVKILTVQTYPVLPGGRQYNDSTWLQAMQDDKTSIRDPQGNYLIADYDRIIQEYNLIQGIQTNAVDEIWMFGGPYFGFYESRLIGKGAFWCNAPGLEQSSRRFVMMGFNYQRGVQEMIHSFGHRAESILAKKFGSQDFQNKLYGLQPTSTPKNPYEQWLLEHGTVHRIPGGPDYGQNEFSWVSALKPEWWPFIIDPNKVN
jgi:hypothetical protein